MMTTTECAQKIISYAYADSRIVLDLKEVILALESDGYLPTNEEIRTFIEGGDDGEIPETLREKLPRLDDLLNGYF